MSISGLFGAHPDTSQRTFFQGWALGTPNQPLLRNNTLMPQTGTLSLVTSEKLWPEDQDPEIFYSSFPLRHSADITNTLTFKVSQRNLPVFMGGMEGKPFKITINTNVGRLFPSATHPDHSLLQSKPTSLWNKKEQYFLPLPFCTSAFNVKGTSLHRLIHMSPSQPEAAGLGQSSAAILWKLTVPYQPFCDGGTAQTSCWTQI